MKTILFFIAGVIIISCNTTARKPDTVTDSTTTLVQNVKDSVNTSFVKNTNEAIMAKRQVPVLCYHRIENGRNDDYTVSPAAFEAQMKILADSGYTSVSPGELYNYLLYNTPLPEKPVMITYDDTRLEHFTIAAPTMEKYGFKGVFFIMTIAIGKKNYMDKEQIAGLSQRGHTVGSHTWDHHMVTKYTPEDWQKQIAGANKTISDITQKPVEYFAYPFGINDLVAARELSKYYKLSFILSTHREAAAPLQMVRRMIVAHNWSPQGMLKVMRSTFARN